MKHWKLDEQKRTDMYRTLYFMVAAIAILMFATRSSFLYPCNNWDDANSYFSVGKSIFHGKLPYRDVFDQKGILLYFLYGICYLISHTTFKGVFLMECILAVFDLWGAYRILGLYVKKTTAMVLAPLPLALVMSSYSFYWGGSAEEICLPFLTWGLYLGLRYFKEDYPDKAMDSRTLLVTGVLAGVVANIKFTVLGFFFAWMMWVAFSCLIRRDWKRAFTSCGIFLGGMAIPFLPGLIYFGVQGVLYDWYWGYVYINVFLYSNLDGTGPSVGERIYILAKILYWLIRKNGIYYLAIIPGMAAVFLEKKQKWMTRLFPPVLFGFLFLGIYIGGSELPYYALPLGVFTVFGFVLLGKVLEWGIRRWRTTGMQRSETEKKHRGEVLKGCGMTAAVLLCMLIVYGNSMNISFMKVKQEDIFLYRFKEIVEQSEHPTLLNIGCLDAGLYTVCDIVPTCQWFQTQTINSDMVYQEQERYIREGQTEYVLARDNYPEVIWEKYELASEEVFDDGNYVSTYYLFRRIHNEDQ